VDRLFEDSDTNNASYPTLRKRHHRKVEALPWWNNGCRAAVDHIRAAFTREDKKVAAKHLGCGTAGQEGVGKRGNQFYRSVGAGHLAAGQEARRHACTERRGGTLRLKFEHEEKAELLTQRFFVSILGNWAEQTILFVSSSLLTFLTTMCFPWLRIGTLLGL